MIFCFKPIELSGPSGPEGFSRPLLSAKNALKHSLDPLRLFLRSMLIIYYLDLGATTPLPSTMNLLRVELASDLYEWVLF